ncbi:aminopeptidase P family protein [Candidatus Peregrinibacteria bacterium]|nr:aminopeptidase P family protein [Candidatus Peregrinibacteria bacterium]
MRTFLVTNTVNIRYLTGMNMTAGTLLITPNGFRLFVDGRYSEAAAKSCFRGIEVCALAELEKSLARVRTCAFEADEVTVSRLAKWKSKFKNTKFVQSSGVIEEFRRSKDAEELRCFRKAQRITEDILKRVPMLLRRPISEVQVSWKIREWAMELGADDMSFETIVAFGTHTSRPHHRPTHRVLQRGHIVQIDMGVKCGGYCSDQSAVYFTGKPTPLQKRVHAAVAEAFSASWAAVRPGVTNRDLDRIARAVLTRHGFEKFFVHSLGHGVGMDIHEGPNLSMKAPETKLLNNEIVTIEPGVYLPGRFGMRLEKEIVVGGS